MTRRHLAVLGANGVYGRHLVPRLIAAGHRVRALVRRPDAATVAHACGAEVRQADIFDLESLRAALEGCEVGVNLATSLPGPSGRGDFAANDHLRREGTPIWIRACAQAGVERVLQQSIAMVESEGAEGLAADAFSAVLAMEDAVRASGLDWLILRGALFYGPGTGNDDGWISRAVAGKLRLPADPDAHLTLVHIADMASATAAAIERWPSRRTLAICDDEAVTWRELFGYVSAIAGSVPPQEGTTPGFPSFRASNAEAREALGWAPAYASYKIGLAR